MCAPGRRQVLQVLCKIHPSEVLRKMLLVDSLQRTARYKKPILPRPKPAHSFCLGARNAAAAAAWHCLAACFDRSLAGERASLSVGPVGPLTWSLNVFPQQSPAEDLQRLQIVRSRFWTVNPTFVNYSARVRAVPDYSQPLWGCCDLERRCLAIVHWFREHVPDDSTVNGASLQGPAGTDAPRRGILSRKSTLFESASYPPWRRWLGPWQPKRYPKATKAIPQSSPANPYIDRGVGGSGGGRSRGCSQLSVCKLHLRIQSLGGIGYAIYLPCQDSAFCVSGSWHPNTPPAGT